MIKTPLVSIIIPCYNDWQYVEQAVNSALDQTYSNIEVIVVDDGSNTKTKEVLKKVASRVTKLITQENLGQSTARNQGIQVSKGEYILVLDSDDFFETSFCEKAIPLFFANDDIKIVSCMANRLYDNGDRNIFSPSGGTIVNFLQENQALGTSMFTKKDWLLCGGYDEEMRNGFEDWEFFIRILKDRGRAYIIQEPLYNYRRRSNSTSTIANFKKYDLLKYIYNKHQELYKKNFETFVTHLLFNIEREEKEKIKNTQRLEFRIGTAVLKPFRIIKSIFN
ncbi:hypothetical protein HNP99_001482 [Flavobacterium sp. 28A]|uniref:glycosyltransferase n=1 Tax=Flavobacterium sp. 28A TaxID=2735895 RepID=UPI001C2D0804|nr:glycosyltransferase [Flavobacterium sp. 28A]NRT15135.1 hypothetical protein [Flavobacterium sp. 28A]